MPRGGQWQYFSSEQWPGQHCRGSQRMDGVVVRSITGKAGQSQPDHGGLIITC